MAADPNKEHTSNIQLYEGSINESLNWTFSLEQDTLGFVSLQFHGLGVATITPSTGVVNPSPDFASRFKVRLVSGRVSLIILNITTSDEGIFSCQLTANKGKVWKRNIKVAVVGNLRLFFS